MSAFAVAGWSEAVPLLVQAELGLHLVERGDLVRVFLVVPHGLLKLLVELLERVPERGVVGVAPKVFEERIGELTVVCRALADGGRQLAGCEMRRPRQLRVRAPWVARRT